KAHQVQRDAADGDLDAVLAHDAGDVAGEVVGAGLGDPEQAVGVAGGVGGTDRDPRLDLGERLVGRGDRADGRVQRPGQDDGRGRGGEGGQNDIAAKAGHDL